METTAEKFRGYLAISGYPLQKILHFLLIGVFLREKKAFKSRFIIMRSILNREFFIVCFFQKTFSTFNFLSIPGFYYQISIVLNFSGFRLKCRLTVKLYCNSRSEDRVTICVSRDRGGAAKQKVERHGPESKIVPTSFKDDPKIIKNILYPFVSTAAGADSN